MNLIRGFTTDPMHWRTYQLDGPLYPELEREMQRQASRAFATAQTPLGYSVSTSITSVNGVTRGSTQIQIGKGTPWTAAEMKELERRFVALV
ncbi:hypothetical protein IAR55_000533 [Kwoniella newhampshirensis]|uniref:Uncharacterized protein n=1 Tax=Kwoniella newhampshirensis TaxID=1651941 RepID=A0AAW0Z6Z6_9TREE